MKVLDGGFCSNCFNHVQTPVVELDAAWDGPVVDVDGTQVSVDDLRLCATCVRSAAEVLDVSPESLTQARNDAEAARLELERWQKHSQALERLLADRPEVLPKVEKTGRKKA